MVDTGSVRLKAAGSSDVGLVREGNEDAWRYFPELRLLVLADGMGGHQAGEVAANEAVNRFCNILKRELEALGDRVDLEETQALIYDTIQEVNEQVHGLGISRPSLRGMGTTLCILYFHRDWAVIAHVGDSRVYRVREAELEQLTADHSLFQELVDKGSLQADDDFERKHVVTKAIGVDAFVEPTVQIAEVRTGDLYFLCSDGLTDLVCNEELAEVAERGLSPRELVDEFITMANAAGGVDNTTVVAAQVEEDHG